MIFGIKSNSSAEWKNEKQQQQNKKKLNLRWEWNEPHAKIGLMPVWLLPDLSFWFELKPAVKFKSSFNPNKAAIQTNRQRNQTNLPAESKQANFNSRISNKEKFNLVFINLLNWEKTRFNLTQCGKEVGLLSVLINYLFSNRQPSFILSGL